MSQCLFDQFAPAFLTFCEAPLYCFPKYPSDTWSNIGPVVAGILIIKREPVRINLRFLGYAAVILGIFSAFFHATGTRLGELLDIAGMWMFLTTCLGLSLEKKNYLSGRRVIPLVIALTIVATLICVINISLNIPLFLALVVSIAALEFWQASRKDFKWLLRSVTVLVIAYAIWNLDFYKILCNPDNHILSGHGVWHLLCGLAFYFIYKHYADFDSQRKS